MDVFIRVTRGDRCKQLNLSVIEKKTCNVIVAQNFSKQLERMNYHC